MTGPEQTAADELDARLSYLAHELLNPLSVAQGYASLLKDGATDADETVRSFAARVCENVEVAVLLMQRLRDASADPADLRLDRRPLDLVDLVRVTVEGLGETVVADRCVELALPDTPVTVDADPVRLRQVVFNLLVHAVRSSPSGTPVRVAVEPRPAQVRVQATGAVIDVEELARSFVGEDGRLPAPGVALGLHVSRLVAEAHGGSLRVEATGSGAQVVLGLPAP